MRKCKPQFVWRTFGVSSRKWENSNFGQMRGRSHAAPVQGDESPAKLLINSHLYRHYLPHRSSSENRKRDTPNRSLADALL